jgi:hypothetical protein
MSYRKGRSHGDSANSLISCGNIGFDRKVPAVVLEVTGIGPRPQAQLQQRTPSADRNAIENIRHMNVSVEGMTLVW